MFSWCCFVHGVLCSTSKDSLHALQVVTMDGDRLFITSSKAAALNLLLNEILRELRSRSHFAVVLHTPYGEGRCA